MLPSSSTTLAPGFCVLHGNRLEDLTDVLVEWLRAYPLAPLDDEIVLVQSNGMAQWLKLALAADDACGISAAQQFQMPARFLWQAYRAVLGRDAVPETSPFDKSRLLWRIMALLPGLLDREAFAPLRAFLSDDTDQRKRYQLAERLADLFDQYQVYRADWLAAWEQGDHRVITGAGQGSALVDNEWQALLWQELLASMPASERDASRAHVHHRFLQALADGSADTSGLPPRIVVFGLSSLPLQALEALHALAPYCQILLFVPNPCQYYWGDIIEDRDLLRRQQHRHGHKLAGIDPTEQHRHANPLLASWGKQGRDFVCLLYDYDERPESYRSWFREIDLFRSPETAQPDTLLTALQTGIFDMEPAPETPALREPDDSVVFHLGHSPQRELEVLHDQLLAAFESAGDDPLRPRDILVMVPDIEAYTPAIEAVFGHFESDDPRFIPYTISDRSQRTSQPVAVALEQLLDLPNLRFTPNELLGLLETPALRAHFGITEPEIADLRAWIEGSGIRWGLDAEQRAALGLPEGFEQNSWWFGLRRMLLGYAAGAAGPWQGIEPFDEVGGLEAALAGRLVEFIDALQAQWRLLVTPAAPDDWVKRFRGLLEALFTFTDEADLALREQLLQALSDWQEACTAGGFHEAIPLTVARAVWLEQLEDSGPAQRFLAGRVNFCTLMPMRSIPFRRVCLLGMSDGAYPRSQPPQDFDLMGLPGQYRPGDRSRRDDDRYLFLEAVLAAREQLYISWVGRDVRDNAPRPPSVLVAQLRDHIDACWARPDSGAMTAAVTREHPLQPFSRRYFELAEASASVVPLLTYAREWRQAHDSGPVATDTGALAEPAAAPRVLAAADLGRFLKDPVGHFFRDRLRVHLDEPAGAEPESEPFAVDGLGAYQVGTTLIDAMANAPAAEADAALAEAAAGLRRAGVLPAGTFGERYLGEIAGRARLAVTRWRQLTEASPHPEVRREITWRAGPEADALVVEDWLDGVRRNAAGARTRIQLTASQVHERPDKALAQWVEHLLACAADAPLTTVLVGGDACLHLAPLDAATAHRYLATVAAAWQTGLCRPLPLAVRTGLALLDQLRRDKPADAALQAARKQYEGNPPYASGERDYGSNAALVRAYPRFDDLAPAAEGGDAAFVDWARTLYEPLLDRLHSEPHPEEPPA